MHPLCSRLVRFQISSQLLPQPYSCVQIPKIYIMVNRISNLVSSSSDNPRRLWQTVNKLLHRNSSSPLPTCTSASALADSLASFFTDKTSKLHPSLTSSFTPSFPHLPSSPKTPPDFSTFKLASTSEISKILFNCPNKQCDYDPIPTWLLKECSALLVPTITNMVNLSLIR